MMNNHVLVLLSALVIAGSSAVPASPAPQATGGAPAEAAAIVQFHDDIRQYLALRKGLTAEITGPTAESSSAQINDASDALAAAIQRARPKARAGDFFKPPVADVIKRRVIDVVRTSDLTQVLAGIDDDGQAPVEPRVYLRFPTSTQMASMPPSLLAALPLLPKELEYRIVGTFLILRDVDAALILDVIPAITR